jgi:hypothetical protein
MNHLVFIFHISLPEHAQLVDQFSLIVTLQLTFSQRKIKTFSGMSGGELERPDGYPAS